MYKVYQVLPGDGLKSIADKLDMEMQVLCELNGFTEDSEVRAGENIVIPNNQAMMFQTYRVKTGDNLYQIAKKYGMNVSDLSLLNGIKENEYIYPNQELLIPRNNVQIYITKENETLKSVSNKSNIPIEKIIKENENIYLLPEQLLVFKKENFM